MDIDDKTPEEIESNLKSITDSAGLKDDLVNGKKVQFFRCAGTGLFFPSDYVRMWGRMYGSGLGKAVVSECLETNWEAPLAIPMHIRRPEQVMYPLQQGGHQVDAWIIGAAEAKQALAAILMADDPFIEERGMLIRNKQLANKNGRLKTALSVRI